MKDYSKKAAKWQSNLANAGQAYKDGINGVQDNPMLKAAAAVNTAIARYTAALQNGSWAASLQAASFSNWKQVATTVGAQRLQDGATKGAPKVNNYFAKASAGYNNIRDTIRAMPNATKADRRARLLAAVDMMEQMKGVAKR